MRTGVPSGSVGNFHEAGFYSSDDEFLALIVPFVAGGIAAGEPVVIGYDARKCDLLRSALPRPDEVTFITDASLYATPAGAIEAYRQLFERYLSGGAGQIRIAGDVPHEGNGGRFDGWDRYESAVNAVWQDYPVWSRCLYDATTVPDRVRDVVERTHRRLVAAGRGATASACYQEVGQFEQLPPVADPLESTTPAVELIGASLARTRHRLADVARGRLAGATFDDLTFAVSEAVVNAQVHGRPPTTVTVWVSDDRVVVHVHDSGPGPADPLTGLVATPSGTSGAGLGLWLSHQLTGIAIALVAGTDGFTVRLRAGRPPGPADGTGGIVTARGAGFRIRAGLLPGTPAASSGGVHAIDGDGSSFCDGAGSGELVPCDGLLWQDVPRDLQCPTCQIVLELDRGPGRP